MLQQKIEGFQTVKQTPMAPHVESARNFLFQKPKPDQFFCMQSSRFDSEQFENENKIVMSKEQALNLLDKTYTGFTMISETEKITDWQMAKKVYHLTGFGINIQEYGMTQAEMNLIREHGLVQYTMNGGSFPPLNLIREGQRCIHDICYNDRTNRKENGIYGRQSKPCSIYYNKKTRHIIFFNNTNGDLITGEKFRKNYFNKTLIKNNITINNDSIQ